MKTLSFILLLAGLALAGCGKSQPAGEARKVLYYQSAMHPWIKSDQPGRCTICGMELTPIYEGETGLDAGGDLIPLSETSIRVLNVQTTEVKTQALHKTLRVAGTIDDDDSKHRVLSAYVAGRIEQLHVAYVGAEVKAGEPLADFYSPMLLQAEREYRLTNAELRPAAESRLRQLGLSPEQIRALPGKDAGLLTSQLLAPVSGTVVKKDVYAGQSVAEGQSLFELADFSTMWFLFRAYESDLPWLRVGQSVTVSTPSLPGQSVTGSIAFIDPNFDDATRATKVRVELANPVVDGRRRLAHRLYAEGVVQLAAPEVLAVPRSAIIRTGPEAVAFVDEGAGGYSRRVVQLGRVGDKLAEVLGGVRAGEQVVVNGNLLLDGQAEMNRAFATHGPASAATNAPPDYPGLSATERQAVQDYLRWVDALTAALAADDLKAFGAHAAKGHDATTAVRAAFAAASPWQALLQPVTSAGHLHDFNTLIEARQKFHPLSEATVALAQAVRRGDTAFGSLKVYRCPMTKNAFPGAPNRADWIQLQPDVRNPYYGAEMLDCGAEVKP
jgi:Cu(I)/Ag(I) efflux system membrane fusion protein